MLFPTFTFAIFKLIFRCPCNKGQTAGPSMLKLCGLAILLVQEVTLLVKSTQWLAKLIFSLSKSCLGSCLCFLCPNWLFTFTEAFLTHHMSISPHRVFPNLPFIPEKISRIFSLRYPNGIISHSRKSHSETLDYL